MHGEPKPPPSADPFELVLWENVAYLAGDDRRAEIFATLKKKVGFAPAKIAGASDEKLLPIAEQGGMRPIERVERLRECASIALELGGHLKQALEAAGPGAKSRKILKRFPGIGEPGAEKILLFSRLEPALPLESNGLRTLLRIGIGTEDRNYTKSYRSVQEALRPELAKWIDHADYDALIRAHQLLRAHGRALCKNTTPLCEACALATKCVHANARMS